MKYKNKTFFGIIFLCSLFLLSLAPHCVLANDDNSTMQEEQYIAEPENDDKADTENETSEEEKESIEELVRKLPADEETNGNENANEEQINAEIKMQEVKVIIRKTDENDNLLSGAKLQILNSKKDVVDEWTSDDKEHEIMLTGGKYILHEVSAPEGYDLAQDKEFEVEVIIDDPITADVEWTDKPCNHGDEPEKKTPMYYVEINSVSYEVYCVNQGMPTPDGVEYNGKTMTPDEIREYTKQATDLDKLDENGNRTYTPGRYLYTDTETIDDYDVSDQTLNNQELYDKVLDIIYHRHTAPKESQFSELEEYEIRFITEYALKNYLNARITTYESEKYLSGKRIKNYEYNIDGELWQEGDGPKYIKMINKFYNREYIYDPSSPTGYVISRGNGNALGNLARHWYEKHGNVLLPAIYAELYNYLVSINNPHPKDMQLYMYSTKNDDDYYQNVLGITGYADNTKIKEQTVTLQNNYSTETTDIEITKTWDNPKGVNDFKPTEITVYLYANNELINTIKIGEKDNWTKTISNLPKYDNGNKIEYSIEEEPVEGYESEIEKKSDVIFRITNYYLLGEGGDDIEPPQTGFEYDFRYSLIVLVLIINTMGYVLIKKSYN